MILNANEGSHGVCGEQMNNVHDCLRCEAFSKFRFGIGLGRLGCCVLVGHLTVDNLPTVGPKILIEMFIPLEID